MCFWAMKMLGTVRWLDISFRASWMASPSSVEVVSIVRTRAGEMGNVRSRGAGALWIEMEAYQGSETISA